MIALKRGLARLAYSTLLRGLTPLLLARLFWRARREPPYGQAIGERLGFGAPTKPGALWLHAVSLGETRAAEPLIQALRAARPGLRLLLTHGTATGRETGAALLRAGDAQRWLPFDTPGAVRRFLRRHRPAIGVLMETEVWPNLQAEALAAGVPMVLANARLSDKSLRKSLRLDALMRPAVEALSTALAQTEDDARRLREAGARDVQVCGNIKFDLRPDPALLTRGRHWRVAAAGRPIVLAASWREGEDEPLLQAWAAMLAQSDPSARRPVLALVPRHPQRFDEVAALVQAAGLTLSRRSSWGEGDAAVPDAAAQADVWLGDSMREMPAYYALADVALLGGSFAPLGGQNLIEAAACGCPVVMGPHTFNFADAAQLAEAQSAARRVPAIGNGVALAVAQAGDVSAHAQASAAALAYAAAHQGASERMAAILLKQARWPG
ncbi:Three-deoxy-D-manno-octulosonic-acid transferase domain protein [Leptothrix cholodnii SP-6]|uniref:3-deoxy-D-manno-octulosonic acid transferase n=1 Tax=Leptothrix cholodnii (strain ATCC 51168 / LMG 8142 / SP-6) TaxID=395495 RepID=B1Y5J5_LEPCP|nr:Three-deoxy-D-manno-octulosonic-acid transferase domain protein [Leptothrix cholodnii SP-6]